MCIYIFIISFTLILAADWSIAVGYWTLSHDWQNSRLLIGQLACDMKLY